MENTANNDVNISDAIKGDFVSEQLGIQASADVGFKSFQLPLLYTYKLVDNNATEGDELQEIFPRQRSFPAQWWWDDEPGDLPGVGR